MKVVQLAKTYERISELIGKMTSEVSRAGYTGSIDKDFRRSMGGWYWKSLKADEKLSYLRTTAFIVKDDLDADYHLGDEEFRSLLYGYIPKYVESIYTTYSKWYTEGKTFEFPQKLLARMYLSKSAYSYPELLKAIGKYQTKRLKREEKGNYVPLHPKVKALTFEHFDMLWEAVQFISQLPDEDQHDYIIEEVVGNVNAGFDRFGKQTKKNIFKLFYEFCQDYLPDTYSKLRKSKLLTANIILDALKEAKRRKFYPPYTVFKRCQLGAKGTKVRAVFGAFILLKVLGALWSLAKSFVKYWHEEEERSKHDKLEDMDKVPFLLKTSWVKHYGKIPIIAWADPDIMFNEWVVPKLPEMDEEGNIFTYSKHQLSEMFGEPADELDDDDHQLEVYGEDFTGFDQSIARGDLEWITSHKKVGWIMDYVLDTLDESEAWVGNLRISGVFFKSGHPFTSLFGSIVHLGIMFNAADYMGATLLGATVLSDDNLGWWVGFNEEKYIEYCDSLGYELDPEKSSKFSRDKIVVFLKWLCGYSVVRHELTWIGDPISRMLGLLHSESDPKEGSFNPLAVYPERGVWILSKDMNVNRFWSKLASYGSEALPVVRGVVWSVRTSDLGVRSIRELGILQTSALKTLEEAFTLRKDVAMGSHPYWLRLLPLPELGQIQ